MEEEKKKNASQPEKGKKDKKNEKKSGSFLAEHKAELKKVTWPNRDELIKETITVIVISLIVGIIIFCMDTVLSIGYDKLIGGQNESTVEEQAATQPETQQNLPDNIEAIGNDDVNVEFVTSDGDGNADIAIQPDGNGDVTVESGNNNADETQPVSGD